MRVTPAQPSGSVAHGGAHPVVLQGSATLPDGYLRRMSYTPPEALPGLIDTMKKAAAALEAADVPFLLGGGLAAWARGGPPTGHDVDFFLREAHAEAGLDALGAAGMATERPPEGWLFKAWDGETLVDLIFRPSGGAVDDAMFARASTVDVMAQTLQVASIDDVLATKVLALTEQAPDFRSVLEIARALREQVDWDHLRARVDESPFGAAFMTLVERLRIAPEHAASEVARVG